MSTSKWPYSRGKEFRKTMAIAAADWFKNQGHAVQSRANYILRHKHDWRNNIILSEVSEYVERLRVERKQKNEGFAFHMWVHHGLSSQAMLFNLVGPLIVLNDLGVMSEAFIEVGLPWPKTPLHASLEMEDRAVFNERQAQPTSIDLVIEGSAGSAPLFVEAKLVETQFGGCSVFADGDCEGRNPAMSFGDCYLHSIGREYWNCLAKHGFLKGAMLQSPLCLLSVYYQFFREVLFALEKNGYFVLLVDDRNPAFRRKGGQGERGLIPFLWEFLPQEAKDRAGVVTIQAVINAIEKTGRHGNWLPDFKSKYAIG